jgi:hypothetical protein
VAGKRDPLDKRLKQLEVEVERLKAQIGRNRRVPWYRQILGQFENDPVFDKVVQLGRGIREAERKGAK